MGARRQAGRFLRQMLRIYESWRETRRFERLQRYGAATARGLGVHSDDDVQRMIEEARRQ